MVIVGVGRTIAEAWAKPEVRASACGRQAGHIAVAGAAQPERIFKVTSLPEESTSGSVYLDGPGHAVPSREVSEAGIISQFACFCNTFNNVAVGLWHLELLKLGY